MPCCVGIAEIQEKRFDGQVSRRPEEQAHLVQPPEVSQAVQVPAGCLQAVGSLRLMQRLERLQVAEQRREDNRIEHHLPRCPERPGTLREQ
jgi:hypothetical protein